jgi:uroporphyrinogen-III synthase
VTDVSAFHCVIATSAHAITCLDPNLRKSLQSHPLYVVGTRTAQAAQAAGFTKIKRPCAQASDLVAVLSSHPKQTWLYLAGHDRKPDLESALRQSGHHITPLIIYEARAAARLDPQAHAELEQNKLDAVLHYSRRSAEVFLALAQAEGLAAQASALQHICLSNDVAAAVGTKAVIAKTPDQEGLFAALEAV